MPIPDFIVSLRAKIGHDLLWLPGATAVVLDGEQVLLVRRADNDEWAPVTGIVDPGEHPAVTAVRETLEETGVTCEVEALTAVTVTGRRRHRNGDEAQYLDHTFRCRYLSGVARVADDESVDVGWFRVADLPPMHKSLKERISSALAHPGRAGLGPAPGWSDR